MLFVIPLVDICVVCLCTCGSCDRLSVPATQCTSRKVTSSLDPRATPCPLGDVCQLERDGKEISIAKTTKVLQNAKQTRCVLV